MIFFLKNKVCCTVSICEIEPPCAYKDLDGVKLFWSWLYYEVSRTKFLIGQSGRFVLAAVPPTNFRFVRARRAVWSAIFAKTLTPGVYNALTKSYGTYRLRETALEAEIPIRSGWFGAACASEANCRPIYARRAVCPIASVGTNQLAKTSVKLTRETLLLFTY